MNDTVSPARQAHHPIDGQFLHRHSPRSFTDEPMSEAEVLTLLEAARWAPSASNLQPVRFAWGLRGDAGFGLIADSLAAGNRVWAEKAAALVVVGSRTVYEYNDQLHDNPTHGFDAGAAWMSLALQAHLGGWVAHAMGGFDKGKAAAALRLPAGHALHAVVAIGRQGPPDLLPETYRPREVPNDRRPLSELAGRGRFL